MEGKPKQQITGPDDGPVQIEFKTIEEVHMFLLERGIDSLRVPPPLGPQAPPQTCCDFNRLRLAGQKNRTCIGPHLRTRKSQ